MLTVLNPATEEPIAELERAGIEETDAAVARAKAAFPAWKAVAPTDRGRPSVVLGSAARACVLRRTLPECPSPPNFAAFRSIRQR